MLIWFTFPINVFKKKLFWFESLRLRSLLLNSRCCVDVWNITKQSQPFLCFTTPIFHFGFEDSWDFGKTLNNPKFFFFFCPPPLGFQVSTLLQLNYSSDHVALRD